MSEFDTQLLLDYNRVIGRATKSILLELTSQLNTTELIEVYQSYINLKLGRLNKCYLSTVPSTSILKKLTTHIYEPFYNPYNNYQQKFTNPINKNITNILTQNLLAKIMSFVENKGKYSTNFYVHF